MNLFLFCLFLLVVLFVCVFLFIFGVGGCFGLLQFFDWGGGGGGTFRSDLASSVFELEFIYAHKQGQPIWVRSGYPAMLLFKCVDITNTIRTERKPTSWFREFTVKLCEKNPASTQIAVLYLDRYTTDKKKKTFKILKIFDDCLPQGVYFLQLNVGKNSSHNDS